jgi:concanavalin A-like lectin/glucanase superfamily protein
MWRSFALLAAIGACGFQSPDSRLIDAAAPDGPAANAPPFCDPSDPHLVACYEFEGDARDSSNHHLDATMVNVSFQAGKTGKAMLFGATSASDVPDSPAFDVTALTIEAWIWPSQLPSNGNRAGILDMQGQYGFFLHAGGDLACTTGVALPGGVAHVATDRWTHVACTYDGTAAALYVDGVAVANASGGGNLNTGGNTGISLAADNPPGSGSRLMGLIDEVRLMNVARTPAQICADAGKAACP